MKKVVLHGGVYRFWRRVLRLFCRRRFVRQKPPVFSGDMAPESAPIGLRMGEMLWLALGVGILDGVMGSGVGGGL
jgi:hypothetical protein